MQKAVIANIKYLVFSNLASVKEFIHLLRAFWEAIYQFSLYHSLRCKRRIPTLRSVISIHFHAIFCNPQIVIHTHHVSLKCFGIVIHARINPYRYHIECFIYWANINVVCLQVFSMNIFDGKINTFFTEILKPVWHFWQDPLIH